MSVSKIIQGIVGTLRKNNITADHSGYEMDVGAGISDFINSGTSTILYASFMGITLEDTTIRIQDNGGRLPPRSHRGSSSDSSSESSSSSSDSDSDIDGECVVDGISMPKDRPTQHSGVKVLSVDVGSYSNGLGLRKDDVIVRVNNTRVRTSEKAVLLMRMVIDQNKKLALEVQRKETEWIKLDNGAEDIVNPRDVFAADDFHRISEQPTTYRVKHIKYKKYLIATGGKVKLSKYSTSLSQTYFDFYQYKHFSGEKGVTYVMMQHQQSKKCIAVENCVLVLKSPPTGKQLAADSGLLFKVNHATDSSDDHALNFEDITATSEDDSAIGFRSKRKSAILMPKTAYKVLFHTFAAS